MTNFDAQAGSHWNPEHDHLAALGPDGSAPQPPRRSRARRATLAGGGAALAAALLVGGVVVGRASDTVAGTGSTAQANAATGTGGTSSGTSGTSTGSGSGTATGGFPGGTGSTGQGSTGQGSSGQGSSGQGSTGQGTSTATNGPAASSTQQAGIVTVVSTLGYQNAESAGTGLVVTSNGEIVTNNHVVDGATSVTVTIASTGTTYKASVVGTDPTQDIAVLQLSKASGLTTAKVANAATVRTLTVGDTVVGVGNAGGTGTLTAATGKVTALSRSITATDDDGGNAETLSGLIETNADIVAGDSGGPLYDADGTILGIDTAGASSNGTTGASSYGAPSTTAATAESYAIPITTALEIAGEIESGVQTSTVHIGLPAFLGVGVAADTTGGAGISSVLSGGPADDAGITAGSVITAVDGKSVTSANSLKTRLASVEPGQKIAVTWTDASGTSHTATVTTVSGPAD